MFKTMIRKIKERVILKKIFLSTFGLSVLFIMLTSTIGYTWLEDITTKELSANEQYQLSQYTIILDNYIDEAKMTAETLFKNVYIKRAIVSNQQEWDENMSIISHTLVNATTLNPHMDSIYILGSKETIIKGTSYTIRPLEDNEAMVREVFSNSYLTGLNSWSYTNIEGDVQWITSIAVGEPDSMNHYVDGICVNLNMKKIIDEMFQKDKRLNDGYILVDESGYVMGHVGGLVEYGRYITDDVLLKETVDQNGEMYLRNYTMDGSRYLMTSMKSDGYFLIHLVPYDEIITPVKHIRNVLIIWGLTMIVASMLLSLLLAVKVYHPIDEVIEHMNLSLNAVKNSQNLPRINELSAMTTSISHMVERLNDYTNTVETEKMVRYLVSKSSHVQLPEEFVRDAYWMTSYCTGAIRLSQEEVFYNHNSDKAVDFQYDSMMSILINNFSLEYKIKAYNVQKEYIAFIVMDEQLMDYERIREIVENVIVEINQIMKLNVNIGLSEIEGMMEHIRGSFGMAKAATNYRFVKGECTVITEKFVEECTMEAHHAFDVMPMIASMKESDELTFRNRYEAFEDYIQNHALQTSHELLHKVVYEVIDFLGELKQESPMSAMEHYEYAKEIVDGFNYMYEAKLWMYETFTAIRDLKKDISANSSYDLINRMLIEIDENYSNIDLNAQYLANQFNISPSYFSRLFNDYMNCAFPDYLRSKRLEMAKKLLLEHQEMSINDICEKVGYNNSSYFTASFKKKFGITPSKYRLSNKVKE